MASAEGGTLRLALSMAMFESANLRHGTVGYGLRSTQMSSALASLRCRASRMCRPAPSATGNGLTHSSRRRATSLAHARTASAPIDQDALYISGAKRMV